MINPKSKSLSKMMLNAKKITMAAINRVKNLDEYSISQAMPDNFVFNGKPFPFDITITKGIITAKILATSFDEANEKFNQFLKDFT
jgi:hypothetical protein